MTTGPVNLLDYAASLPDRDDAARRSEQSDAERRFKENLARTDAVRKGHVLMVDGDGRVVGQQQAAEPPSRARDNDWDVLDEHPSNDRETFIDLDIDDTDVRYITLKSRGGDLRLTVPPVETGAAFKIGRVQTRLAKLYEQLVKERDDRRIERINDEMLRTQEEMVRLIIPDLPHNILGKMKGRAFKQFMDTVERMVAEALGQNADIVGYVRQVYRRSGEPNGKGDDKALEWLHEQLRGAEEDADLLGDPRPNGR